MSTTSSGQSASGANARFALARLLGLRLLGVLGILVVISFLTFSLLYLAPGDIVKNLLGTRPSSPEAIAAIRAQYHLDDPFFIRYLDWLGGAVRGDFGESIRLQQPVNSVIQDRLGLTIALVLLAFILALLSAIPLGIWSASKEGRLADRSASAVALFGLSAPSFAISILLVFVFSMTLPILPAYGSGTGGIDTFFHLVLPGIALAAGIGAILMRITRASVLRELQSDSILFARSRGLSESTVRRLAVKAAAIPIVTSAGLVLTFIVGGTIIVESVFALPGLGFLLQDSVLFKDIPVVQAVTLLVAATIAIITILVDFSYVLLDPRVRTKASSR